MPLRKLFILCCLAVALTLALTHGCTDMGSNPPPRPVITSVEPDSGGVGDEIRVEGSGFGSSRGNSEVLFGTTPAAQYNEWRDDEIDVVVPLNAQTGLLRVRTAGGESDGVLFRVLGSFGVAQDNVNLTVGDSIVQQISGGTQPYVLVSIGDTTVASASVSGTSLTIRAVSDGISTVVIGENSVPQLRDTINVTVSAVALISFAAEIQPIFTASCVNQGCHPGSGSPFSLQSGVSYDNLVGEPQTVSPQCTSLQFRVQAGSAVNSVLYGRISGTSCGSRMPFGQPSLSPAEVNLIRDWINQGALNN